jgi:hypothetical protein
VGRSERLDELNSQGSPRSIFCLSVSSPPILLTP